MKDRKDRLAHQFRHTVAELLGAELIHGEHRSLGADGETHTGIVVVEHAVPFLTLAQRFFCPLPGGQVAYIDDDAVHVAGLLKKRRVLYFEIAKARLRQVKPMLELDLLSAQTTVEARLQDRLESVSSQDFFHMTPEDVGRRQAEGFGVALIHR